MKGNFQIIKIFGIPVQVHWTFALVVAWISYLAFVNAWNWAAVLWATLSVITLFTCVIFHEFGHALTARRFGVNTRDIILSPIGGVARLDRLPESPYQEFLVAIAGPMVNIAIAVLALPYLFFVNEATRQQLFSIFYPSSNVFVIDLTMVDYFFFGLFLLNGVLAIFNLLPAFPMDGGRVLRALLSLRLGRTRATRIAAYIGQSFSVLLLIYALWQQSQYSIVTAFVGVFVFLTAMNENRMVRLDSTLDGYRVSDLLRRQFTRIYVNDPMEIPVEELTRGMEKNFLVFDHWQNLIGLLPENRLLSAVKKKAFGQPVRNYINDRLEALLPEDSLKDAFTKLHWQGYAILPVYDRGKMIGVLDVDMLDNFLRLQDKLDRKMEKKELKKVVGKWRK